MIEAAMIDVVSDLSSVICTRLLRKFQKETNDRGILKNSTALMLQPLANCFKCSQVHYNLLYGLRAAADSV